MDADRFDAVSRLLGSTGTRRGTLAALLSGALGLSGLPGPDAAWAASGKCKKPCGACKRCQRGKCVRTAGRIRCQRGKCVSVRNGTRCSTGTCLGGRCAPFPTPPPPPCRTLRQECAGDCCGNLVCANSNCASFNVCVQPAGGPCNVSAPAGNCDCENTQRCTSNNTCEICEGAGALCDTRDDCCNILHACQPAETGGPNRCCAPLGTGCRVSSPECCAGLFCDENEPGSPFGLCTPTPG